VERRLLAAPLVAALLVVLTSCSGGESDAEADPDAHDSDAGFSAAADTETCVADATAVGATPDGYAKSFPLPEGTVVYHVEDRGPDGVIATGVTATPFDDVLDAMNAAEQAGFHVTSGETEEDDAEANWTGNGYVGRWAIKKSASCPGETVIQLLSKSG
jgi:hypothetical protein